MIAKLSGLVDLIDDHSAIIDVGGVGYLVFCSARTLGNLAPGDAVSLSIETHVREDHIHLYGFADLVERDWFRLLTTVQGVGAKVALGILGVLSGDELVQAIAAGDKTTLSRPPGVGPRLAGRLASELKEKIGGLTLGPGLTGGHVGGSVSGAAVDAVSALVNLGYNAAQASGAINVAAASLGEDAGVEDLVRAGLGELAPREHAR